MMSEAEIRDKLYKLACKFGHTKTHVTEDLLDDLSVFIDYCIFDCEATKREKEILKKLLQEKK